MRRDEKARRWVLRELERIEQRRWEPTAPERPPGGSTDSDARKAAPQRLGDRQT